MTNNPPIIISPVGMDAALEVLQEGIREALPWMGKVFGESELISRGSGRERSEVFAVYAAQDAGTEDGYVELMPRHDLPGFCFFHVRKQDSSNVQTGVVRGMVKVQADVDLVAFWHYQEAFPDDSQQRTVRHVEQLLTEAITSTVQPGLVLRVQGIVTPFKEVFKPATLTETDQLLMRRPYGCLRIVCKLEFNPYQLNC